MGLTIRRPITVKAIVTDLLKQELASDLQEAVQKLDNELAQIDFHSKRMVADVEKHSPGKGQVFQQQVEGEKQKRLEAKAKLMERLKEVAKLTVGQEVIHSTVDSEISVDIGDSWSKVLQTEIILKDGVIVEIRNG